jgi:hypothetical protein
MTQASKSVYEPGSSAVTSQFAIGDLGEFAFKSVVRLVECLDDVVDNVGRNRAGVGVAGA